MVTVGVVPCCSGVIAGLQKMRGTMGSAMLARAVYVVALLLVVLVVLAVNSPAGRRWLEDRADTVRWFTNEVKTLRP